MTSLVELLEHHLGSTLDERLIRQADNTLAPDNVYDIMQSLYDFASHPFLPERAETELRAFVGYTHSKADMIFYNVDNNAIKLDYFKRLLLYYDRVALTIHTEFFFEKLRNPTAITDLMHLLYEIKPLVEKNIINFVAEPVLYNADLSFEETFKELTGKDLPELGGYEYNTSLLADLNGCHALDFDYVTTLKRNWSRVRKWYVHSPKEDMSKEAQHLWATSILKCDLPNLGDLTYEDIISIRKQSDAFEEWRRTLNELFELFAKNRPSSAEEISKEIQYFSRHRIAEKKRRLDEEIESSGLKRHLKSTALIITVSFLGQLLASRFIDMPLTKQLITLLTGASGAASMVPFIQKRKSAKKNYLLSRYYGLIEEEL